jgi:hypothetical protein
MPSAKDAWQATLLQECEAKHNDGCSSSSSNTNASNFVALDVLQEHDGIGLYAVSITAQGLLAACHASDWLSMQAAAGARIIIIIIKLPN